MSEDWAAVHPRLLRLHQAVEDWAGRGQEELVGSINTTGHLKNQDSNALHVSYRSGEDCSIAKIKHGLISSPLVSFKFKLAYTAGKK